MKIIVKKSFCYGDAFWPVGAVVDVDRNTGVYLIGTYVADEAPNDAQPSERPDPGPARRSLESDAMEKAATAIVTAVAKASTRKSKVEDLA